MKSSDRILITGGNGLIGGAIARRLRRDGFHTVLTPTRAEVDFADPVQARWAFSVFKADYVFHCAARVGGIKDNAENPVDFLVQNLRIQDNVLMNAAVYGVKKLLFLASSCCYPADSPQPLTENLLFTGPIHKDTEPYALAKLAGIRLCQYLRRRSDCNFISALPCNVFGPGDNFDPKTSHVVPGLIARMSTAAVANDPEFKVWGDGTQRRELIYVEDLVDALLTLMEHYHRPEPINAGSGQEITIRALAEAVAKTVEYGGDIVFDNQAPSGVHHKLMNNSKISALGATACTSLPEALLSTYEDFLSR